jgi:hypothetical protein
VYLRAREFRALPDDLLNGIKKVTFSGDLAPRTYSKHASLHVTRDETTNSILLDILLLTSVATDRNSAPVVFGHNRAMRSNRMLLSTLILRAWIRRMCARPSLSGNENSIRRSRRPGRIRAGSSVSGLYKGQLSRCAPTILLLTCW